MGYLKRIIVLLATILIFIHVFNISTHSTVEISRMRRYSGTRADDEPPRLVVDNTPGTGNTGEELTFSANFTDNVSVIAVRVNYTYDNILFYNRSMNNTAGESWSLTITVNITATKIDYYFHFNDSANNTNTSVTERIDIIDIIPPVANAGADMSLPQGAGFYLDGSNSTDNIGIVNYTWNWKCLTGCNTSHMAYGVNPFIYALTFDFSVDLIVRDAEGNIDNDSINITITDIIPPISDAGDDIIIDQHEIARFNGNASSDNYGINFGIVNYTWSFNYSDTVVNLYGMYANFSFDIAGEYEVILTVADAAGNTGPLCSDSVLVTVRDITPPQANAGEDVDIDQHGTVHFNANLSTDNVFILHFTWSFFDDFEKSFFGISLNYTFHNAGTYNITLNVSDGAGNCAYDTFNVTVRDTTAPMADAGWNWTNMNYGELIVLNGSGSRDNVGIINYTWSFLYNNSHHYLYGEEVSFRFFSLGEIKIRLNVTDAEGNIGVDNCTIEVVDKIPPKADAGPDMVVGVGLSVILDANGTTDHSKIISYIWMFTYNKVTEILNGSRINFTFDIIGIYETLLIVKDEWDNTATDILIIEVRDTTPPVAEAGVDRETLEGKKIHFSGDGWDNIAVMNYSWKFTYNNSEVILEGKVATFLFDIAGNYSVTLTVTDEAGNYGKDIMWVNVSILPDGDDDDDDNDDDDVGDDDDGDDDVGDDDDVDDDVTDNDEKKTAEKSFLTSPTGLIIAVALLILIILGVVIAVRKKRRIDEPEAAPGEKAGVITADVHNGKRDGAIEVEEDAVLKDDGVTETEGGKGAEEEPEVETDEEPEVETDEEPEVKAEEEVEEVGDAGIDIDVAVDDEAANELSKNNLSP